MKGGIRFIYSLIDGVGCQYQPRHLNSGSRPQHLPQEPGIEASHWLPITSSETNCGYNQSHGLHSFLKIIGGVESHFSIENDDPIKRMFLLKLEMSTSPFPSKACNIYFDSNVVNVLTLCNGRPPHQAYIPPPLAFGSG